MYKMHARHAPWPCLDSLCSNELELSWDPLEASGRHMSTASRSILSGKPLFSNKDCPTESPGEMGRSWRERFLSSELYVQEQEHVGKEMLSPIHVSQDQGEESPLQSDVPNLVLQPGKTLQLDLLSFSCFCGRVDSQSGGIKFGM